MTFHHIGIAVESIEKYFNEILNPYMGFTTISKITVVESQNVKAAFCSNSASVRIELVESIDDNSPTANILKRKNGGFYHLGFITDDFDNDINLLRKNKFRRISNRNGIAYFLSPHYELYELMDRSMFCVAWKQYCNE